MQDPSPDSPEQYDEDYNWKETNCVSLKTSRRLGYSQLSYDKWKYTIWKVFRAIGIVYILQVPKPVTPSKTAAEDDVSHYKNWLEDDFLGRQIVLAGMDDDVFLTYYDYPSVRDIMDALGICFNFPSIACCMVLLKTYTDRQMFKDSETAIRDHISDQCRMEDDLRATGITVPKEMKAAVLIDGVPLGSFNKELQLRLINEKELTLSGIHSKAIAVGSLMDLQRKHNWPDDSPKQRNKRRRGDCFSCGRPGHYKSECPDA